jgi:phytol kinase
MALLSCVFVVFVLLNISEVWWRRTRVHGEISRKFVHITVGSFVAFWPFFLTWYQIELLSLAFLAAIAVSKYLNIFKAIHSVQRPTGGEIFFALAVGAIALITHDKWIYMTALLQMSLADGLAAIIGVRYGRRYRYLVFGQTKSIAGTIVFAVVSFATLLVYNHYSGSPMLGLLSMLSLTLAVSLIENLAVMGLDNLLVPLLVAVALGLVH